MNILQLKSKNPKFRSNNGYNEIKENDIRNYTDGFWFEGVFDSLNPVNFAKNILDKKLYNECYNWFEWYK